MYINVNEEHWRRIEKASEDNSIAELLLDDNFPFCSLGEALRIGVGGPITLLTPQKAVVVMETTEGELMFKEATGILHSVSPKPFLHRTLIEVRDITIETREPEEKEEEETLDLVKELESRGARMGTGDFAILYNYDRGEEYSLHMMPIAYYGSVMGAMVVENDAQGLCDLLNKKQVPFEEVHKAFLELLIKKKQEEEEYRWKL